MLVDCAPENLTLSHKLEGSWPKIGTSLLPSRATVSNGAQHYNK